MRDKSIAVLVTVLAAMFGVPRSQAAGPSLFELESRWTDQEGKAFTWSGSTAQATLMALIYTSCQMSCPLMTRELQAIERALAEADRQRVRVLLFSFDPARDTVAVLKEYATKNKLDARRWTLLTGTEDAARELAVAIGVQFKRLQNGEFSHSNAITVLDSAGQLVHQQPELGTARDATIAAIRKVLDGQPTRP